MNPQELSTIKDMYLSPVFKVRWGARGRGWVERSFWGGGLVLVPGREGPLRLAVGTLPGCLADRQPN